MEQFRLRTPRWNVTARPKRYLRKHGETDIAELLRRIKQGNAEREAMTLSYASFSSCKERTFWQLKWDADSPSTRTLKDAKILIRANAKTGHFFTMKNGLECTVKRANLTRRQHQVIGQLNLEHGNEPEYLSWLISK